MHKTITVASLTPSVHYNIAHAPEAQTDVACAQVHLYGKRKTPPKWQTQEWHLSNAAWAPSEHTQNHSQMGSMVAMG